VAYQPLKTKEAVETTHFAIVAAGNLLNLRDPVLNIR
jgi:hypothetical protein